MSGQQIPLNLDSPVKFSSAYESTKRYIDVYGGRGSSKSWSVAQLLIVKSIQKKCRILCAREVQNSIEDSVHKLLGDVIRKNNLEFSYFKITDKSIINIKNGSEFLFKGLYRNTNDIKSTEGIDYCWIEEAQSISRSSLDLVIPTIRKEGSQIFFTYNPENEDDPVHKDFTLADRDDVLKIEMNYRDNPWFPDVLRADMLYDRKTDPDKYAHIWEGKCVTHSQAQIFHGKWIIEEFTAPRGTFFLFGSDWGFGDDPTACIRCWIDERQNYLYIDYEVYEYHLEIDDIPARFKEIPDLVNYPNRGDSSRPDTISYLINHGLPLTVPCRKGKGSVKDGISFIRSFKKIIIHPRCKNVIDEFYKYSYIVNKRTGAISNEPEDKHNHAIDSIRYALEDMYECVSDELMNRFGIQR